MNIYNFTLKPEARPQTATLNNFLQLRRRGRFDSIPGVGEIEKSDDREGGIVCPQLNKSEKLGTN